MNVRFFNYYRHLDSTPGMGGTLYGNYLGYCGLVLTKRMEEEGFFRTTGDSFDIAVFSDLDKELFALATSLPPQVKKILCLVESPVYTPFGHYAHILHSDIWHCVLSYSREVSSPRIHHYDIAVTGTQCPLPPIPPLEETLPCGVFVGTHKGNFWEGMGAHRDALMLALADRGEIDVYGRNWPSHPRCKGTTDDKIRTLSRYRYVICAENARYSGYVTEKIGDSILAERPCLYFGDVTHARRRFGNSFVPLPALTVDAFQNAKAILESEYDALYAAVLAEKARSTTWIDSSVETMLQALRSCRTGACPGKAAAV